ncbi:PREDICTED: VQ motif-containing protein 10 [Tarenaya hassleriana]|uniref:VQ motif-containing protein 10 n=1 Tax=Tarenaya hassleriana TaxID=28532 RepID=UPI00053CA30D|nr:PREDICTED: VQ motif-containing protein 10 [Tarenaya hassleriana]
MSGRGKKSEPMKVVFINTQYVETDARSFKTVVQHLTGKDATVPGETSDYSAASASGRSSSGGDKSISDVKQFHGGGGAAEFDRFVREMPPVDELYKLWSDY